MVFPNDGKPDVGADYGVCYSARTRPEGWVLKKTNRKIVTTPAQLLKAVVPGT